MEAIPSILGSTKKKLGLDPEENTDFDEDLIDFINAALSTLTQIGIGPSTGFQIEDDSATWSDFIGDDPRMNLVKPFVFFRVRLAFDKESSSYVQQSIVDQLREYEWRLNFFRENPESFPKE